MTAPDPRAAAAIAKAREARDAAMARAEQSDQAQVDKELIDAVIRAYADTRRPFSANDIRPHLGNVRTSLIGSRFYAARVAGQIRELGLTTSTKKNTHAKPVACWIGAHQ